MVRCCACMVLAVLLLAGPARATQQGNIVIKNWNRMDDCARKAQAAYPDFTAEANAKREAKLQDCLSSGNLPPRVPSVPAQPR